MDAVKAARQTVEETNMSKWKLIGALVAALVFGTVTLYKPVLVSFEHVDMSWASEIVKGPKIQVVRQGGCALMFDRDSAQLVHKECVPGDPYKDEKIALEQRLVRLSAEYTTLRDQLSQAQRDLAVSVQRVGTLETTQALVADRDEQIRLLKDELDDAKETADRDKETLEDDQVKVLQKMWEIGGECSSVSLDQVETTLQTEGVVYVTCSRVTSTDSKDRDNKDDTESTDATAENDK